MFKSSYYPNKSVYFIVMGYFLAAAILVTLIVIDFYVLPVALYVTLGYIAWAASLLIMGIVFVYYFHSATNRMKK